MPASKAAATIAALHRSLERLDKLLTPLSPDELLARSYASDWSVAQVASHLGSGAEIFGLIVDAGVRGAPSPGRDAFAEVWARWNAKQPTAQAGDCLESIERFVTQVESLGANEQDRWRVDVFGQHFDLAGFLTMRLAEHVLHGWDIAVVAEPDATLPDDEVPFVFEGLSRIASHSGRPDPQAPPIRVITTDPQRSFELRLDGESPTLTPAVTPPDDAADGAATGMAVVRAPAEAFIRLVYGRLDRNHTPDSVRTEGVDLDTLRRAFPGL